MSRKSTQLVQTALKAAHAVGAHRAARPMLQGLGVIFMLHNVSPAAPRAFEPNRILRITPDFLRDAVVEARAAGYECVSMDEAARRMSRHARGEDVVPFACFTFDDGYRDNAQYAYPVLKQLGVPFTIYVPSDFPDGRAQLWWLALEEIVRRAPRSFTFKDRDGATRNFATGTSAEKLAAFHEIYWSIRGWPEAQLRDWVCKEAAVAGFDATYYGADTLMTWDELRALNKDPLVTIGAHTVDHYAVGKLEASAAFRQMVAGADRIAQELETPCHHLSYPYGDCDSAGPRDFEIARSAGFATAVTTRKGLIGRSPEFDPMALPRLSLNGDYQDRRYLQVLLSGLPFAMMKLAGRAGQMLETGRGLVPASRAA